MFVASQADMSLNVSDRCDEAATQSSPTSNDGEQAVAQTNEAAENLEVHIAAFQTINNEMKPLLLHIRRLRKELKAHMNFFQGHMEENDLQTLDIGDNTLHSLVKQKISYTEERLLQFIEDPSTLEAYKEEFAQEVRHFRVKKRKIQITE